MIAALWRGLDLVGFIVYVSTQMTLLLTAVREMTDVLNA
jgi:hypothetical protein